MSSGVDAAPRRVGRSAGFAGALIIAIVNALATRIGASVAHHGALTAATELFGVSAIVWLALWVIGAIALNEDDDEPFRNGDAPVLAALILAAILPMPALAAAAVAAGGLYLVARSESASAARRIGLIALTLSAHLFWGPLLLKLFGSELLGFDAKLAALMAGGSASGNIFQNAGNAGFIVGQACSSLNNVSLAAVLAMTLTQWLRLPLDRRILMAAALAMIATVLVNGIRLAAIARRPDEFIFLHEGGGAIAFGWAALIVTSIIIGQGILRHPAYAQR